MSEANGGRQGRCLCGAITFAYEGAPLWVAHCHCESCRRQTASPVTTFVGVADKGFRWTEGAPAIFESSPGVRRSFCTRCGTPLAYEADRFPGEVHLYVATLDDPNAVEPSGHVHTAEQIAWFEVHDALPRFARSGSKDGKPLAYGPARRDGA